MWRAAGRSAGTSWSGPPSGFPYTAKQDVDNLTAHGLVITKNMSGGGGTLSLNKSKPNIIKTQFIISFSVSVFAFLPLLFFTESADADTHTFTVTAEKQCGTLEASRCVYIPVTTILRYMLSEKYHVCWRPEVATLPRKCIYFCTQCKKWDSSCHRNKLQKEIGLSQDIKHQEVLNLGYGEWWFCKRNESKKVKRIKRKKEI
jgi:hypothetical protein